MNSSETINKVLGTLRIKERYFILTFISYDPCWRSYNSKVINYVGQFMSKHEFELEFGGELIGIIELSKEDYETFIFMPKQDEDQQNN